MGATIYSDYPKCDKNSQDLNDIGKCLCPLLGL